MDDFAFSMMSFMPADYLDMADVAFWDDTAPAYEEPMPERDIYEVDYQTHGHDDMDMADEHKPIEEDWVESGDEARSTSAVSTPGENTLAPSSRNPGYAEERRTLLGLGWPASISHTHAQEPHSLTFPVRSQVGTSRTFTLHLSHCCHGYCA